MALATNTIENVQKLVINQYGPGGRSFRAGKNKKAAKAANQGPETPEAMIKEAERLEIAAKRESEEAERKKQKAKAALALQASVTNRLTEEQTVAMRDA
ncbi:hypothetical protein AJ79_05928 [Helicocarpus griseus UAMH5409]|uniref:Uncharacterized protein n=1 Tax=Helicocarpus griseus UAMH5409 TaxID=1447875 RepID=A0A2B7XJD5_9EURO|nr:hypothetical protein AJ79_05928 [Helicocarpus griseus UAMH5409]